jgi:putative flippase GtrA
MSDFYLKFLKFGVVGFSGVFVDFGVTWLLKEQLKVNQYVANTCGFLCAVVSNFMLNRLWTFQDSNPDVMLQFGKFLVLSLVGLGLNNLFIYFMTEKHKTNFYVAKLLATGVVMIWNFWANSRFTFRS